MRRLNMIQVGIVVKDLMNYATGEECDFESYPVILKDEDGKDVKKLALVSFKESDRDRVISEVNRNNGKSIDNFFISPVTGCLITLYDKGPKIGNFVSFDEDDDYPVKSMIPDDYSYAQVFFEKFLNFRDGLRRQNSVIKDDDIFQYFISVTGGFKKTETIKDKIQKRFGKKQ